VTKESSTISIIIFQKRQWVWIYMLKKLQPNIHHQYISQFPKFLLFL